MNSASKLLNALAVGALLIASGTSHAKIHPPRACHMHVSELRLNGKPLTYETAATVRNATRLASTGTVYAPVVLPDGRDAIYAIETDGCARKTSLSRGLR